MNNDKAQAQTQGRAVDILFSSGVRQDLESRIAPVGALVLANNVEFDAQNRLVRRDGYATVGTSTLSKTNGVTFPIRRTAQTPSGERLMFSDSNTFLHFPQPNKASEAGLNNQTSTIRATLEDVIGIAADETGAIYSCDGVATNGYVLYAYKQYDATTGLTNIYVDVLDATLDTGTNGRAVAHFAVSVGSDITIQHRVVLSGGTSVVFILWKDAANLKYASIDLAAATLSFTAPANLVTDLANTGSDGVFDVDTTTTGWVLVYTQNTPRARLITYNSSAVLQNSFTWLAGAGAVNWRPSVLAVHGNAITGDIRAAGYDPATFLIESVVSNASLAANVRARFDPGLDHAKPAIQMAITGASSVSSQVLFSNYASTTLTTNPRGHLYCYSMVANATMTLQVVYANYSLAAKIYRDIRDNNLMALARFNDATGFQSHLLVLDFGRSLLGPYPQFHVASGRVPLKADNANTGIGGAIDLAQGGFDPGRFQFTFVINIAASSISGNQAVAYSCRCNGWQRFLNTPCQGESVIAGATPLSYDGQRLVELSFYSYPILNAGNLSALAVGGFMPQGIFQYRAVYEWTDAKGNRHQSPACPAITLDLSGAPYVAGTNLVLVTFPAYFPTRKQVPVGVSGTADVSTPVRVVVYRTTGNGSIFYRMAIAAVNNNSSAADDTVIGDVYSDAQISVNEVLYTSGGGRGELATTAPPPTVFMTTHAQRLWGIDGENPERIWCTKVLSEFTAPGYNQGLQITIPGAGKINGLAGQDGKLYALATNGIYLASFGDGIDNAGNGSFPSPQLIDVSAGCDDPRSVLIASNGIYFSGKSHWGTGIFVIRRGDGQPISIGDRVRAELSTNPICRGVVERIDKSRVEFLFVEDEVSPFVSPLVLYYHYDYLDESGIGQWTVSRPQSSVDSTMESLGIWDGISVLTGNVSSIGIQTLGTLRDFGGVIPVIMVETCDVRPFGLVGYGQIASVSLFGTCIDTDPLFIEASYDSGDSWTENFTFTPGIDSSGAPVLRRWETPTQKLPTGGSVRIRFSDPASGEDSAGSSYFHGLSLQFVPLGGNARLDDARRG